MKWNVHGSSILWSRLVSVKQISLLYQTEGPLQKAICFPQRQVPRSTFQSKRLWKNWDGVRKACGNVTHTIKWSQQGLNFALSILSVALWQRKLFPYTGNQRPFKLRDKKNRTWGLPGIKHKLCHSARVFFPWAACCQRQTCSCVRSPSAWKQSKLDEIQ